MSNKILHPASLITYILSNEILNTILTQIFCKEVKMVNGQDRNSDEKLKKRLKFNKKHF